MYWLRGKLQLFTLINIRVFSTLKKFHLLYKFTNTYIQNVKYKKEILLEIPISVFKTKRFVKKIRKTTLINNYW